MYILDQTEDGPVMFVPAKEGEPEEWVILRINRHVIACRKPWVSGDWEVLATGFKTNQEALLYVPLFNEDNK